MSRPDTSPTVYARLNQLIPHVVPVSAATWWRWVKQGKAPQPIKLSARVTVWKMADIEAFLASQAEGGHDKGGL